MVEHGPAPLQNPRRHLFEQLGLPLDAVGMHRAGLGAALRETVSTAALSYRADGADFARRAARQAAEAIDLGWKDTKNPWRACSHSGCAAVLSACSMRTCRFSASSR